MTLVADVLRGFRFPGKGRLFEPLVPRSGMKTIRLFGSKWDLDLSDFIQRQIYSGTFEMEETGWVYRHLKPGMTFVDVGANVGYWTALASSLVGEKGRVIAFEPSPYAFQRLEALVADNRLANVEIANVGLSASPGETTLYIGAWGNHTPTMVPHESETTVAAHVETLDRMAELRNLEHIDLLKIDVEGFEHHVLLGASRLLSERRVGAILCEFNDHWLRSNGTSSALLEKTIASSGFVEVHRAGPAPAQNRLFVLPQH